MRTKQSSGFTIVELLIVIVIIAILAAISIVLYNSIQARAVKTALQSDLRNASTKIDLAKAESGSYPTDEGQALALFTPSEGTDYQYTSDGSTYYLTVTSDREGIPGYCKSSNGITEGVCPGHHEAGYVAIADGSFMQIITNANCPSTRTRAVDARDNHTYWVQKLADNKCWMLTNLAYAGGGTNTYSDTKVLQNGTSDSSTTYTEPKYYIHSNASPTTEPTSPSTNNAGGGAAGGGERQYGYHYNWCAAMGAQIGTSACLSASTPSPDTTISVCPAGWRLPTGTTTTGDFTALNVAVNGGSTITDQGLLENWLGQRGGHWTAGFSSQGLYGFYWSSTEVSSTYASSLDIRSANVYPARNNLKNVGFAVRCVAI